MSSSPKPSVLLLSLNKESYFDSGHANLLSALHTKAVVSEAQNADAALQHLAAPDLAAVFVTDPAASERRHRAVRSKLVQYAKAGGTVVFGGHFSSFIRPADFGDFFRDAWGLPWKSGAYHRTTFALNRATHARFASDAGLPAAYSMKALHVKDAPLVDAVYVATDASHIESHVFAPDPIRDITETPVVFTQVGSGYVGYIGDVNAEDESTSVILAMLGLSA